MKIYPFFMLLFVVPQLCMAEPEIKGTPSELTQYLKELPQTVEMRGEASLELQSDNGIIQISVTTKNSSLEKSLKENQSIRNDIFGQLISGGIKKESIKGSKYSSTPEYGMWSDKPKEYRIDNIVKISIEKEADFQLIGKIVDANKRVQYLGIEFQHEDKESIKRQLTKLVLANLESKVKIYENALKVKLRPKSFIENISLAPEPITVTKRLLSKKAAISSFSKSESYVDTSYDSTKFYGTITVEYYIDSQ